MIGFVGVDLVSNLPGRCFYRTTLARAYFRVKDSEEPLEDDPISEVYISDIVVLG